MPAVPKFRMRESDFVKAVNKYRRESDEGLFLRPSLSHFCGRVGTTEEDLLYWLTFADKADSAYYIRAQELGKFLCWLRGEMFSGQGYNNQTGKRMAEIQLSKDHGDGVTYDTKSDKGKSGITEIKISFGGSDPRAKSAGK